MPELPAPTHPGLLGVNPQLLTTWDAGADPSACPALVETLTTATSGSDELRSTALLYAALNLPRLRPLAVALLLEAFKGPTFTRGDDLLNTLGEHDPLAQGRLVVDLLWSFPHEWDHYAEDTEEYLAMRIPEWIIRTHQQQPPEIRDALRARHTDTAAHLLSSDVDDAEWAAVTAYQAGYIELTDDDLEHLSHTTRLDIPIMVLQDSELLSRLTPDQAENLIGRLSSLNGPMVAYPLLEGPRPEMATWSAQAVGSLIGYAWDSTYVGLWITGQTGLVPTVEAIHAADLTRAKPHRTRLTGHAVDALVIEHLHQFDSQAWTRPGVAAILDAAPMAVATLAAEEPDDPLAAYLNERCQQQPQLRGNPPDPELLVRLAESSRPATVTDLLVAAAALWDPAACTTPG